MKVWDVRRAAGSLLTLDQHSGDKSKASSEAGTVKSTISFLVHMCYSSISSSVEDCWKQIFQALKGIRTEGTVMWEGPPGSNWQQFGV